MGKSLSIVRGAFKNFNVENRAMKYVEKSKISAIPSPKHTGTTFPGTSVDVNLLNPQLNRNVDSMHINTSFVKKGVLPEGYDYVKVSDRKYPQKTDYMDPRPNPVMDFGFVVPDVVPAGKLTMRNAVEMIKAYQTGSSTIEQLSQIYSVDKHRVEQIVEHFVLFVVPTNKLWMPPLLDVSDVQLLSEPVVSEVDEEPLGGPVYNNRREALGLLDPK